MNSHVLADTLLNLNTMLVRCKHHRQSIDTDMLSWSVLNCVWSIEINVSIVWHTLILIYFFCIINNSACLMSTNDSQYSQIIIPYYSHLLYYILIIYEKREIVAGEILIISLFCASAPTTGSSELSPWKSNKIHYRVISFVMRCWSGFTCAALELPTGIYVNASNF